MGSTSDKMSGNAKQAAGKVSGNKELQAKGKLEEARGNVKDALHNAGDKISEKIDEVKKK